MPDFFFSIPGYYRTELEVSTKKCTIIKLKIVQKNRQFFPEVDYYCISSTLQWLCSVIKTGALQWPLGEVAAEFPVEFSCRETGTPPDGPPLYCCGGGKAGFRRVLQQSFIINITPRPRGITFTPVKTCVSDVTSSNGHLIRRDFIGLSLGKKKNIKGGYLTCFSSR